MKIGKIVLVLALVLGGLALARWFTLGRQAARLAETIERDVLAGDVPGPASVAERVLDIARREGIQLRPEQVSVHMANPEEISTAAAMSAAQNMEGLAGLMVVELDYRLSKGPVSRHVRQRFEKPIYDSSTASSMPSSYSSAPPPAARAVDPGLPARDVNSYRQDVQRAVGGQND